MFTVYIIYSLTLNKYYVGYTTDITVRLKQHNSGFSSFTSKANDWQIKYQEVFKDRKLAMIREKQIKSKKSRKYIEALFQS